AVHSLKDVPMDLPDGFALACVLAREDPHDAFVSNRYASLAELPQGAVVGTSSLRRLVLLKALRPDLVIQPLRGNLDTRLRKLDEGQYDGIVLAAAGLKRLKLESRIRHTFVPDDMLPAAGQGALGIEVRADRADLVEALATLAHSPTWLAVTAERTVSRAMGGSCSMPLAAFVTAGTDGALRLDAAWGEPATADALSGAHQAAPAPLVHARQSAVVRTFAEAEALGEAVAAQLRAGGAVWAGNTPLPA
ncbi:MAG: hydroxymethylbilane synthase, partial [Polaromonas sp.]